MIKCLIFLQKITWYKIINQVLNQVIHLSINFFLSPIIFINLLMIILKSELLFLDISKAFDKVWHKGLIYKLKQNGISGNILNTIINFLSFRKQWVVLDGQVSHWTSIEAGVPQGSYLDHYYFWFILMTFSMICQQMLSSLQMILPSFLKFAILILQRLIWIMI